MSNHFLAYLLALPLMAVAWQEASAWSKFNLGLGANLGCQSGGSASLLWGLWQSSDSPLNKNYSQQYAGGHGDPGHGGHGFGGPGMGQFGGPGMGQFGGPGMGQFDGHGGYGGQADPRRIGPNGQDFTHGWMSPMASAPRQPGASPASYQPTSPVNPATLPANSYYPAPGYGYYQAPVNPYGN